MDAGAIEDNEDDPSILEEPLETADSPVSSSKPEDTDELEIFREQWREELRLNCGKKPATAQKQLQKEEAEATSLYWMGAAAEKSGDMNAAIMYYRQACQLVPDIDFKLSREQPPQSDDEDDDSNECDVGVSELLTNFCSLSVTSRLCQPERSTTETHFSSIPVEVVRYILRWVVSSQLNMRSLEQVSMVCKGFYCMAREPQLWRMACRKLWKDSIGPTAYGDSWRRMFILKPHLHFNGVYISKTSYVRPGERSLDSFYKPYHTVVYYRYLRFFPDGSVMYQTSPEEPIQTVPRLCHKHCNDSVLLGDYSLQGNKVTVDVIASYNHTPNLRYRGRGRGKKIESTHEQRFNMELILKSSSNKRRCDQLIWHEYYCHSLHKPTGHVQTSKFSIDYTYSPFYFSRVKGYTTNSTGLLT